jgi:tetratricopeptide (TPR) repeat protein
MIPNGVRSFRVRRTWRNYPIHFLCGALLGAILTLAPVTVFAQAPPGPQPPAPEQPAPKPSAEPKPAAPVEDEGPAFNPVPAEKDVEVATYYIRKGDPDAAIPRLEDAIKVKPDYARPRLMLAQIYEKKSDKENAVKYYREFLQIYPHAPDAKKVREKIAKLSRN